MLCQLVCVDRRYQRMNSFNIRELQSILQRRFFTDLVNTADHHQMLESLAVSMRFKSNSNDFIRPDQSLFYNFGLNNSFRSKSTELLTYNYTKPNTPLSFIGEDLNSNTGYLSAINAETLLRCQTDNVAAIVPSAKASLLRPASKLIDLTATLISSSAELFTVLIFPATTNLILININTYLQNLIKLHISPLSHHPNTMYNTPQLASPLAETLTYETVNQVNLLSPEHSHFIFTENSNPYRFLKFNNPLINYDYKCGHYLTIWDQLYPQLATSLIEVSRGIRKAP